MKSTAKAESVMRGIKEELEMRVKGSATIDTVREAKDSEGWPMLILSDNKVETAGAAVIAIRMKAVDAVSKDVFGNDLVAFAPHKLELCWEKDATDKPTPADADVAMVTAVCAKKNICLVVKETDNGDAVVANLDAATIIAQIDDLLFPTKLG